MSANTQLRVLGSRRYGKTEYPCGLCGVTGELTKTHVPPQCAGNSTAVGRQYLVARDGKMQKGREVQGGLYMYGLCEECNGLQSRYDAAYAELADALRPFSRKSRGYDPSHRTKLPGALFRPGAVARSMLIGAHGLTPQFRRLHPDIGVDLRAKQTSITADGLHLVIAIARGTTARVAGATSGFFARGPLSQEALNRTDPVNMHNLAEVYFPPLAWAVTDNPELHLLSGWKDVTSWLTHAPDAVHLLSALVPELPQVAHPTHTPFQRDRYLELFAGKEAGITEIIECTTLVR